MVVENDWWWVLLLEMSMDEMKELRLGCPLVTGLEMTMVYYYPCCY